MLATMAQPKRKSFWRMALSGLGHRARPKLVPFGPVVEHVGRIDQRELEPGRHRGNLRIGHRHVALGENLLALAEHELVEQHRGVWMRCALCDRRPIAERHDWSEIERLDRRALALLLLGLVAVGRQRQWN